MAKSRKHVITNGRATFYAALWNDFRQAALDKGWALGLHGSMASDLDIMAMPWVDNASPVDAMIRALESCLTEPDKELWFPTKRTIGKPNSRVVYTIHIFADFYIDLSIINPNK